MGRALLAAALVVVAAAATTVVLLREFNAETITPDVSGMRKAGG